MGRERVDGGCCRYGRSGELGSVITLSTLMPFTPVTLCKVFYIPIGTEIQKCELERSTLTSMNTCCAHSCCDPKSSEVCCQLLLCRALQLPSERESPKRSRLPLPCNGAILQERTNQITDWIAVQNEKKIFPCGTQRYFLMPVVFLPPLSNSWFPGRKENKNKKKIKK